MQKFSTVEEYRNACEAIRRSGHVLGLVPTMGALHQGHASLMRRAREDGCKTAVTIFVNPTQFGPNEDLAKYPRTLDSDLELCRAEGVELVLVPTVHEMYPSVERTKVRVTGLTDGLCGTSRPTHFEGVATIVTKLFAATGACHAYFGRKDYQQFRVVEALARDLLLPVRVIGCTTVREADGLALSSRNRYLSSEDRVRALGIARGLALASRAFTSGERRGAVLAGIVRGALNRAGLREDYVALRGHEQLEPLESSAALPDRVLLAIAAFCGTTRLIDNIVLGEEPAPKVEDATP